MSLPFRPPDAHPPEPRNLAELLERVENAADLSAQRRRDYRGAVRTVCAILGRDASAIPAGIPEIDRLLAAVPRAVHQRADKTVANLRSRLRSAILQCSGGSGPPQRGAPLAPRWSELRGRLGTPRLRHGLSRLMRVASASGVEPEQVDDRLVERIAQQVAATRGEAGATAFRRQAASCWNEACASVPGWPGTPLTTAAGARRVERLPLDAFPATFQRDVERYLAWAAGAGRLARDGSTRALSPGTVRLRREHLRLAASALARRLGYTRRVINLAALVEPVNFKLVLAEYVEAAGGGGSGAFVQGLAVTLFGVARQWVKAPASQLDQIAQSKRRLGSRAPGLAEKNRRAIAAFDDARVLADLLALPQQLLDQAVAAAPLQPRQLRRAQIAVAIQLLLAVPLQLHQLAALRIGRERRIELPVAAGVHQLLDRYLDRCHDVVAPNPEQWLFARPGGKPASAAALRDGIARETRRALGVALTPSQFRHIAAALVLRQRPGDLGLVRDLLGHRDARTTAHLYGGIGAGAVGAYAALLEQARAAKP